jgi:hypothetical protein
MAMTGAKVKRKAYSVWHVVRGIISNLDNNNEDDL